MRFHTAIISGILLSSTVLAGRLHEHRQSQFLDTPATTTSKTVNGAYWAGAGWEEGSFFYISGTLVMPNVTGESGAASATWVGIDGSNCSTHLVAAVLIQVGDNGTTYQALSSWYPVNRTDFPDLPITPGDKVRLTVAAASRTKGFVTVENLTTNKLAHRMVQSTDALCQQGAEMGILEYPNKDNSFAHFGNLTFTNVVAIEPSGFYTADEVTTLYEVKRDGRVLTSVSASVEERSITIKQE